MNETPLSRRDFLAESAAAMSAVPLTLATDTACADRAARAPEPEQQGAPRAAQFRSRWDLVPDRVWPGPEFWTNPLQDWRVAQGRLECVSAAPGRNVHILTRQLAERAGTLEVRVRLGSLDARTVAAATGSAGFLLGVQGPLKEYRNNLVHGTGLAAGLRATGELFIGDGPHGRAAAVKLDVDSLELRVIAEPAGERYRVQLSASDPSDGRLLGEVSRHDVPAGSLVGNLALAANFGAPPGPRAKPAATTRPAPPAGRWWFDDWRVAGTKVDVHEDRCFGPILFSQYTLHQRVLKLTAQMPPLGPRDEPRVHLQIQRGDEWQTIAEETIHPAARTATFRVPNWNDREDLRYRLVYRLLMTDGTSREGTWSGTIRRDPVDAHVLTVADISCNAHYAFPNTACVASVARLNPDLIAFTGDQYYESTGGFGVERHFAERAVLDVLRKWYQHGWTWRELMRDRPCLSIPDDHDVYHGNLWGEAGKAAPGNDSSAEAKGGYKMMAEFVNAVHRMQTAHHPDSPAAPGLQGITGYYGPLTYGRVSFAILADRQYKSGPDGKVPPTTTGRADHVNDPDFDPKTADLPRLQLLGEEQLRFLREWAADWRGADMKAAVSQTIFTAMATHHGRNDNRLVADYDTNGWPQRARNAAVRELRRAFAFHLAGDQHLPAVVQYGIDAPRDAVFAFASPAVNNLYPRWFRPEQPGANRREGAPEHQGDFRDSFGHPLTVLACANPQLEFRPGVLEAETDKSAGFGIVRFNKPLRTVTVECWPLLADPLAEGTQFPDWPVTVRPVEDMIRADAPRLPELHIRGVDRPVVRIVNEADGETLYSLRLPTGRWRPFTLAGGPHTVYVSDPETGRQQVFKGVVASAENSARLEVTL